jgi:hypothetical protein
MVSTNLSQPTPFERYRLQLYLNISNSYMIQIHIGFKFIHDSNLHNNIHIHSNNNQIFYNIQIYCMYTLLYSRKLKITSIIYAINLS